MNKEIFFISSPGNGLFKKKKKKEKPRLVATADNWCLLGHSAFRPDLSHRLYPDPFSNASNEYVARCARS